MEALIAYDCSGAVLLMGTLLGGLITGTCAVVLTRHKHWDREMMMGSTAILMGMVLVCFYQSNFLDIFSVYHLVCNICAHFLMVLIGWIGHGGGGKCSYSNIHMLRGRSIVNTQVGPRIL